MHTFEEAHTDSCTDITFSPVNHMLMGSVGLDKQIIFFDIFKNKRVVQSIKAKEALSCISFCR